MGDIGDWLLHDDQHNLFEALVAFALNLLFLVLVALLLWPLGKLPLALSLAKGYGILWIALWTTALLLTWVQRALRINLYDRGNLYIFSNLAVSGGLQIGWAAFAVLTTYGYVTGAPLWVAVILYLVGLFSCLVAFYVVASCYQGAIYKLVTMPLALISYLLFSVWPAAAQALFGRFFELF